MKISIAMCTYNGGAFIRDQLDSIVRQTRLPDELIVSDDGSSDDTVSVLQDFAASAPFPVYISLNERTLGTLKNTEKVLGACNKDIIAPCDQDDIWHTDKLELIEKLFLSAPRVGLVFSDAELVDVELRAQRGTVFGMVGFDARKQRLFNEGKALEVLMAQTAVNGATMAYRSTFRELILPIPSEGPLIQDGWTVLMIAAVAEVAFINKPLMKYRQHPAQQMGVRKVSTVQSVFRARKTAPNCYLAQASQFQLACDRLMAANKGNSANGQVLSLLRDKIAHLHVRATMPSQRFRRLLPVLREVFNRHYHKYSQGLYSAAKDLLT